MCKIQNLIGLAAVSCALFSCTESEVTDHSEVNEHPAVASEWIKVNMGVGVEKGTSGEEGTESRTPAAVDETDRPDSQYMLDYLGIEKERTRVEWVSAAEGAKFAATMNDFAKTITELGENRKLGDLRCKK